jgi:DNA topoisomerase IA
VLQNPGWLAVYGRAVGEESENLPAIAANEKVSVLEVAAQANQTKPPPR